ncbi:MAG: hypothetical protein QXF01_01100 [Candidatus Micrarchaeaceae archaeon]
MAFGFKQSKLEFGRTPRKFAFIRQKPHIPQRNRGLKLSYALLIIAILIIAALYIVITSGNSSLYTLTTNRTIRIGINQTIILESYASHSPVAIEAANYTGSSYTFLITRVPVLANPVYKFTISDGQIINLSDTGSQIADFQAKLLSSSNGVAALEFIPIPAAFGIRAAALPEVGASTPQQFGNITSQSTSTIPVTTATPVSTTPETTIQQSNGPYTNSQVLASANQTEYGILMSRLRSLYVKDTACTAQQYNSTYSAEVHSLPTGPNDYYNASFSTPTNITASVNFISGYTYLVNYSTVSKNRFTNGPALSLELDAQSNSVIKATFEGNIFGGQSYSQVNSTYFAQASISGNCGALIP